MSQELQEKNCFSIHHKRIGSEYDFVVVKSVSKINSELVRLQERLQYGFASLFDFFFHRFNCFTIANFIKVNEKKSFFFFL